VPVYSSACPRNCYSTCSLRLRVEDGRIVGVEPHEGNRATPEGACLKGLAYVERAVSPERILHPIRRTAGGGFERVSWDAALDLIAENLRRCHAEHGPRGLFYYAGSGTKGLLNRVGLDFWRLTGGCTTTYGDLCWPAGLEATRLTLGENKHNAPWDLVNARLIVLWGKNPAETNLQQMPFALEAQRRGAHLVVIDPRRTESAERAELLVQPRPGTDGALALGVAHLLVERGGIDRAFIAEHVHGFDEFAAMLADFPPARSAEICGVPLAQIERLAELFGTTSPATICAGFGMQRFTNSGQTMRALIALLAITGNLGRPGAGWQFANLQSAVFGEVPDPVAFFPPAQPDGVLRVSVSTARLGRDMLAAADPPLKMAWIERGNPVLQNPETHVVRAALRALDFRVVVDQFMTDTAREADLVLPAKAFFEQSDVIGAYWHPYIQLKRKVAEPPGEVKPESEIYRLLADRLGLPEGEIAARIPGPADADVEAWLEEKLAPFPELNLERLGEGPVLAPGHEEVAFADLVFPTPSGRIELLSREAVDRWGVDALPVFREPEESPRGKSPEVLRYPLQLLTPNGKNRIHSQFGNLRMIRALGERHVALLSPIDAAARGIAPGDRVRVHNERGEVRLEAELDLSLRPGCVVVGNGWWIADGGTVNFTSRGRETDMGHGAAFHDNLVEVEKAP